MTDVPWPGSRRQIDLAGERLRDWWFDFGLSQELVVTDPVLTAATGLFVSFREGFQVPVSKTAMGLRSFLRSEGAPVIVSQRLKRSPTILNKLGRYPAMKYSRMEDIGGCRAILPGRSEVEVLFAAYVAIGKSPVSETMFGSQRRLAIAPSTWSCSEMGGSSRFSFELPASRHGLRRSIGSPAG